MSKVKTIIKCLVMALGTICFVWLVIRFSAWEHTEDPRIIKEMIISGCGALASLIYIQLTEHPEDTEEEQE